MLGWSAAELANAAGVGRLPLGDMRCRMEFLMLIHVLSEIKSALESAGIEFTGDPLVNPGVTLRIKRDD